MTRKAIWLYRLRIIDRFVYEFFLRDNIFMKRIVDANLNRATEALRILEEISRFIFDDVETSEELKNMRHKLCSCLDYDYEKLIEARDTGNDVGRFIENPTQTGNIAESVDLAIIFKSNIKRLQQALRALAQYCPKHSSIFENARYESYTVEKKLWEMIKMKQNINVLKLRDKKLYLVTNSDKFKNDDDFLDAVAFSLKGGVKIVQLREKNANSKRIIELGKKIRELCSIYDALFIVNDRVDIAKIVDADGVHLGQDDIGIGHAREILGETAIVGISTHAPEQALKAVAEGADYIGVGPVFETPTKQGRKAVGLEYVKWAAQNVKIPFFAIGGIDRDNFEQVIDAGASRIAVVRAIINDPQGGFLSDFFTKTSLHK